MAQKAHNEGTQQACDRQRMTISTPIDTQSPKEPPSVLLFPIFSKQHQTANSRRTAPCSVCELSPAGALCSSCQHSHEMPPRQSPCDRCCAREGAALQPKHQPAHVIVAATLLHSTGKRQRHPNPACSSGIPGIQPSHMPVPDNCTRAFDAGRPKKR
jgi:hypothetical protein